MDTATGEVISRGGEGGRCRVIKEEIESSQSAFLALVAFVHQGGYLEVYTVPLNLPELLP